MGRFWWRVPSGVFRLLCFAGACFGCLASIGPSWRPSVAASRDAIVVRAGRFSWSACFVWSTCFVW
jgi:hypothetical protein